MLALAYLTTLLVFLLVFVLVYALLAKTKILGSNSFVHLIISLTVSFIFIMRPTARAYTLNVLPWVVAFLVSVFFIILIISFVRGDIESIVKNPAVGFGIIIILLVIFLISGMSIIGPALQQTLQLETAAELREVIFHPAVLGVIGLFVVAAIVAWVLNK